MKLKEQGKTILLASHNKEDIEVLCDEVFEMEHGKLQRNSVINNEKRYYVYSKSGDKKIMIQKFL